MTANESHSAAAEVEVAPENETLESTPDAPVKQRSSVGALGTVVLATICVAAVIFGLALTRQNETQPESGLAPDFTFTTFEGERITLSNLRGKVVVVNFWASWCGPCRDEAPELEAAWQQYKDRGDVVFLGIAYTDTERLAREYIQQYGITYPNGLDFRTAISEEYHITGVPETFIIDRTGHITDFKPIPMNRSQIAALIDKALAKGVPQ